MAARAKAASAKLPKSKAVKTNQAVKLTEEEQWQELCNIAFGESWEEFKTDISKRLEGFKDDEPIVQSTSRALEMIKTMMFDKISR